MNMEELHISDLRVDGVLDHYAWDVGTACGKQVGDCTCLQPIFHENDDEDCVCRCGASWSLTYAFLWTDDNPHREPKPDMRKLASEFHFPPGVHITHNAHGIHDIEGVNDFSVNVSKALRK